jgi:hypothetical protein
MHTIEQVGKKKKGCGKGTGNRGETLRNQKIKKKEREEKPFYS